jgi:hypothetical protein
MGLGYIFGDFFTNSFSLPGKGFSRNVPTHRPKTKMPNVLKQLDSLRWSDTQNASLKLMHFNGWRTLIYISYCCIVQMQLNDVAIRQ